MTGRPGTPAQVCGVDDPPVMIRVTSGHRAAYVPLRSDVQLPSHPIDHGTSSLSQQRRLKSHLAIIARPLEMQRVILERRASIAPANFDRRSHVRCNIRNKILENEDNGQALLKCRTDLLRRWPTAVPTCRHDVSLALGE